MKKIIAQKYLLLLLLPCVVWFFIFYYIPMSGMVMAFKDYSPVTGIWNSPYAGLKFFRQFYQSYYFGIVIRNTVVISSLKLMIGFPVPIIFALLLNEIRNLYYRRLIQTISYLPHFLSWVVALGIISKMLSIDGGVVNEFLKLIGREPVNFLAEPRAMWPLAIISEIWKETGWNAIIYLAALSGINPELYESAEIDGASRLKQIWHISLPGIKSAVVVLLILATGTLFKSNFDQLYLLGTPPVINKVEVIDTYIYRQNLQNIQYSLGTAVGLVKSLLNIGLVILANKMSQLTTGESLF